MVKYTSHLMRDLMAVLKALADENRARILGVAWHRQPCACQLVGLPGLARSTVSKHVSVVHRARLVKNRGGGRGMYYRAADAESPVEARRVANSVTELLGGAPEGAKDVRRMTRILKIDREADWGKRNRC